MTGLTGLVDTLIADRLSQRADLVRLPPSTIITGPAPVVRVEPVANDVRIQPDATGTRHMPPGTGSGWTSAGGAAPQELSAAARAIGAVLAELPQAAGPVRGTVPIAPHGPATSPEALAHGLASALTFSGLFYESHVAAFASGLRDLPTLLQEPQARPRPNEQGSAAADGRPTPAAAHDEAAGAPLRVEPGAVQPHARTLVAQQLDLLATGVFQWRGEAWPGVPMQWTVEEERERSADEPAPHVRQWSTTVSLQMADLGAVAVRLTLLGRALTACITATGQAIPHLRAAATDLQLQMSAIGLELPQLTLTEGEPS